MSDQACSACFKSKAPYVCGVCGDALCKKCADFVDAEDFSFFARVPEVLSKGIFCPKCYADQVAPQVSAYADIMARAREVYIFDDTQGKESRAFSREESAIEIHDCPDRTETVLRLAFLAAERGFNGLVDVSISSEKVRNHAFQNLKWRGRGTPTHIDPKKLDRNKSFL